MATRATRMGDDVPRLDAADKVTGRARFPSDMPVANPAYGVLLTSDIARGRIRSIDRSAAMAIGGVRLILTHEEMAAKAIPEPAFAGKATRTFGDDAIEHDGQLIGIVVADTLEIAREAAARVRIEYAPEQPSATIGSAGSTTVSVANIDPKHEDPTRGDARAAIAGARWRVAADYETPAQHHNAIELFTTTCVWEGDRLTVHEPSQFITPRGYLAQSLGIPAEHIRVISHYCGGGFGGKHSCSPRTVLVATAARQLGRPVKLMVDRPQGFTVNTFRAETRHHVEIGADAAGRFTGLIHQGWEVTSRPSTYNLSGTETTARMYAWPTVATKTHIVHADRNSPGFMRCPHELPYMFALESAIDELAHTMQIDPVELRRRNDTQVDPLDGRPFSSRALIACLTRGAERFGWHDRATDPGTRRDGDWRVGYGVATACYPSNTGSSAARIAVTRDGRARVQIGFHEIGNGAYTVIGQTAAASLGLSADRVAVELGDTALPPSTMASASNGTASTCNAVVDACEAVRARLAGAAVANGGFFAGADPTTLALRDGMLSDGKRMQPLRDAIDRVGGSVEASGAFVPPGIAPGALDRLGRGIPQIKGGVKDRDQVMYGFGAQFVEVRVHAITAQIKVPRALGVFSAGTIISPRTAHSQLTGGMIWGIGSALFEQTEIDPASARYLNTNLADYLIATNLDIDRIEAEFLPEHDTAVNPLSIKGIGEIGTCGMNAAIANAVFNATGKRIRSLPIRPRDLL